jgi:hypothetical protein
MSERECKRQTVPHARRCVMSPPVVALLRRRTKSVKYRVFDDVTVSQMLDHDALEQCLVHASVPNTFRINDDDWSTSADAEARCLTTLHSGVAEQQPLALKQAGEQAVELTTTTLG